MKARADAWAHGNKDATLQMQGRRLRRFLRDQVAPYCPFYRERFKEHRIDPDDIRSVDDLQRLPFTSKADLLNTPEHPKRSLDFLIRPDEKDLSRRPDVIARALLRGKAKTRDALQSEYRPIFMTSTTGRSSDPVLFLYTAHDIVRLNEAGRRLVGVLGGTREDRLLNVFPYAPHLAFWQGHYSAQAFGLFCVSTGGGKVMGTDGNLRIAAKMKPTALLGMPTFIYHLLSQAVEEEIRFDDLGLITLGGEKVPDGLKRKLAELARQQGAREDLRILATYGFTESKMAWPECPHPIGSPHAGYHLYPDFGLFEVVDPESGEVQPEGSPGELVYTALDTRGTVVLRYRTGDVIDGGLTYEPCPYCGRSAPRLVGRISRRSEVREMKLDKVKGTLVDFNALEHVLDADEDVGGWQIELRKVNDDPHEVDELILHVEKRRRSEEKELAAELTHRLVEATELRPNEIHFHSASEMRKRQGVGTEMKEKRLVDNRAAEEKPAPPREKKGWRDRVYRPHKDKEEVH